MIAYIPSMQAQQLASPLLVSLWQSGQDVQLPHAAFPFQLPHAAFPVQLPHAAFLVQLLYAAFPVQLLYAAFLVQLQPPVALSFPANQHIQI